MSPFARKVCYMFVWVLEHLRLYFKGTLSAMGTMAYCVDSGVVGGKADIFSPCWWFIGQKGTGTVREAVGDAAAAARAVMIGVSSGYELRFDILTITRLEHDRYCNISSLFRESLFETIIFDTTLTALSQHMRPTSNTSLRRSCKHIFLFQLSYICPRSLA